MGWFKINFSKFDLKQIQTNVGHSMANEIIIGNSKNISYSVKKGAVLASKIKLKVVNDFV